MIGKAIIRVLAGLLVGVMLGVAAVIFSVWNVARQDNAQHADTIVVLGAAEYNGTPSKIFQYRLGHALALYKEKYAAKIVTVGGNRVGDRYTEAEAGRDWLIAQGAPADAVVAVPEGSNTLTSAIALGKVYQQRGWKSAIVVTDPWHTLRAKTMIGDRGITTFQSPTRSGPAVQDRSTEFQYIMRESAAILYYGFTGSSNESGPEVG